MFGKGDRAIGRYLQQSLPRKTQAKRVERKTCPSCRSIDVAELHATDVFRSV
jgi:hypothetical protein